MNRNLGWAAISTLGAVFAVHLNGCSLIGLAAGSAADANKPRFQQVHANDVDVIQPGSRVRILLRDSTYVHGVYRGLVRLPDAEYRPLYDAWRATDPRGGSFPEIGEKIELDPGGKSRFRAFVAGGVETQSGRWGVTTHESAGWLVRHDGTRLDLLDVRDLVFAGRLPLASVLRVETADGERRIALDRVELIDASTDRHAARTGFIVGLAFDALLVWVVTRPQPAPSGCQGPQDDAILRGFTGAQPSQPSTQAMPGGSP